MKNILFVFRGEVQKRILQDYPNFKNVPTEFLYGMNLLPKSKYKVSYIIAPRGIRKSFIEKFCFIFEKPFSRITKLGLPIDIYPLFNKQIKNKDILFCINDATGLGILFWKKLGFIKGEVIVLMQSLAERIKYFRKNHLIRFFIRLLLKKARTVLVFSDQARRSLIREFKLSPQNIKTFYFGIDTDFWKKISKIKEKDFILSVGNDMNRDYQTLIKSLPENIKLKIITKQNIDKQNKNIEVISDISDMALRKLYNQCLLAVIPSIKLKNESSGLSSCLQLMACKKAVIVSRCLALEEIFDDKKNCLFYEPENTADLRKKIVNLYKNKTLREKISKNALLNIQKHTHQKMAKNLDNFLSNSDYQLSYIIEPANWVIKDIGKTIVKNLNEQQLSKAQIATDYKQIRNQIIHFGSKHTFQTLPHSSNKVILTWFHFDPNDKQNGFILKNICDIDIIHTSSSTTKEALIKIGVPEEKIIVIPLGVDLSLFKPVDEKQKIKLRKDLLLPKDKIIVGSFQKDGVGWNKGFVPKLIKGPDIFCKALEILARRYPIHVLLTGPARGYVIKRLEKAGISYTYNFLKTYKDIVKYYQTLDLYLITSRVEGGPKALLECWASGIPLIATKVGMVSDIATDKKNLLLAKGKTPKEIAELAKKIIKDRSLKENLVKNALMAVRAYHWEKIAKRYYNELYVPLFTK